MTTRRRGTRCAGAALMVALLSAAGCGGRGGGEGETAVGASSVASKADVRDATPEPFGRWTQIGERNLASDGRHETLRVPAQEAPFSALRFVLKFGKLEIRRAVVKFRDGSTWVWSTPMKFGGGVTSRAVQWTDQRPIAQIDFDYAGVESGRSSQIEVWAQ